MDKGLIKRTMIFQACFFLPQVILVVSSILLLSVAFRFRNPFAFPIMGIVLFIFVLPCALLLEPAKKALKEAKQNEITLNIIVAFLIYGILYGVFKSQSG